LEYGLAEKFKKIFWSNLITTFKFVGIVVLAFSVKIIIDAVQEDNSEDLFFPIYLLAFIPVVLIGVYTYTKLKLSTVNKFVCSLIFGAVISASFIATYFLGSALDDTDINIRFIKVYGIIIFITTSLIYLQLPWKKDE
jgi:hypothetical protein